MSPKLPSFGRLSEEGGVEAWEVMEREMIVRYGYTKLSLEGFDRVSTLIEEVRDATCFEALSAEGISEFVEAYYQDERDVDRMLLRLFQELLTQCAKGAPRAMDIQ